MTFTAEQRQKGLETRLANKALRDSAKASRIGQVDEVAPVLEKMKHVNELGDRGITGEEVRPTNGLAAIRSQGQSFNWEKAPLEEALNHLADAKRAYESAAQIVLRRQSTAPKVLKCWVHEHHTDLRIPRATKAQCRKTMPDGRWVFRDDGVFEDRDGVRVPHPAFCCSQLCYTAYVTLKPINALSRH